MPPSTPKRRRGGGAASRGRKKQKRLDAIRDVAPAPPPPGGGDDSDEEALRRSTRVRRAPVVLDTSPLPSPRHKRPRRGGGVAGSSGSSRRGSKGGSRREADAPEMEDEEDEEGSVVWRSRLRDRVKGKARLERRARTLWFEDDDDNEEEDARTMVVDVREGAEEEEVGEGSGGLPSRGMEVRDREINLTIDLNVESHEAVEGVTVVEEEEKEKGGGEEEGLQGEDKAEELGSPVLEGENDDELACDENNDEVGAGNSGENERLAVHNEQIAGESTLPIEQQMESDGCGPGEQVEEVQPDEQMDDVPTVVLSEDAPKC